MIKCRMNTTLNSTYNEKNMWRFSFIIGGFLLRGNIFIGELEIFGAEVFLCYSQFFDKDDFVVDGVECNKNNNQNKCKTVIYCNKEQKTSGSNKYRILIFKLIIVNEHNINIEPDYNLFTC